MEDEEQRVRVGEPKTAGLYDNQDEGSLVPASNLSQEPRSNNFSVQGGDSIPKRAFFSSKLVVGKMNQ